ncbi:hypothetical protein AN964_01240 [Heyndrickxia shackletonii]|uniref:Uncharacterized protein n=1 Tax=Heyndrickxia shackletonii TaxID=157838 RepID=A0A0Q3WVA4_9BACI|nr:hypothetical protein [Heyndrickxia shackletonii]KQL52301.1 hypothetical protein AN964_01240 [Heyndrickxia shackletonii]NEZ00322.1 hypothetical protein [Heyndrickxia shackletonii]
MRKRLIALSYLFFSISVMAKMVESLFSSSHYFYYHYLNLTLIIVMIFPLIGFILACLGDGGKAKRRAIAIILNGICIFLFLPLALLNFWIINFGK